jgi:hypothetical protein
VQPASQTVCPHCARPLSEVEKVSEDHIVSRFLGGTWVVPCCKTCNDVLGGGIETRLLLPAYSEVLDEDGVGVRLSRPQGWLGILSQAEGLTDSWVFGHNERSQMRGGEERHQSTRHHFGTSVHEWDAPWYEVLSDSESVTRIRVAAPQQMEASYIKHLEKKYRGRARETSRAEAPPEMQQIDLNVSIYDLRRLTAKAALCAGARTWGDLFLTSPAAQWLRVVLDVGSEWPVGRVGRPPQSDEPHAGGRWPVTQADADFMLSQMEPTLAPVLARTAVGVEGRRGTPPSLPIVGFTPTDAGHAFYAWHTALRVAFPVLLVPHPLPAPQAPAMIIQPPAHRQVPRTPL